MKLRDKQSGDLLESTIKRIIDEDYEMIALSNEYVFDWRLERYSDVFKISLLSTDKEILGLMSIDDYPDEKRINVNLIEVGKVNRGKEKSIDRIAGCLLAFAAKIAFSLEYNGFVTLEPKMALVDHYRSKYGFENLNYMMFVQGIKSNKLINKFLSDEEE